MKKHSDTVNARGHSEWVSLIDEWIHNEKDRMMLKRYLLDDVSLHDIAEEFDYSEVQIQRRMSAAKKQLFMHVK